MGERFECGPSQRLLLRVSGIKGALGRVSSQRNLLAKYSDIHQYSGDSSKKIVSWMPARGTYIVSSRPVVATQKPCLKKDIINKIESKQVKESSSLGASCLA